MLLSLSTAALLIASPQNATPEQATELEEIVVTGERLKRIRVKTKRDPKTGVLRCVVRRTSGDPALDAAFCAAVLPCAKIAGKAAEMETCLLPRLAEITRKPSSAH
jgi:hypothetical protein